MKRLMIIITPLILASCMTDVKSAKHALIDAGYHPITVGGYDWLGCGQDDFYSTKFKAYSSDSTRIVKGCVCGGIFKGQTIRLD